MLTREEKLKMVKEDPFYLYYLKWFSAEEQTEELCLEAVKRNGLALEYVQEQTPGICLAAIKQNPCALEYVKEQTEELCLEAVKQDGWTLEFVQQQTPEICLEALRENVQAWQYVSTDYYKEVSKQREVKLFHCQNRSILVEKINNEWVFTVGCQRRISKKRFIQRIYNEGGGLAKNPHRQEYLDILKQF